MANAAATATATATAAEETIERHGAVESENSIIRRHLPRIRFLALPFVARGVQLDDLMQVGQISLLAAIKSWREEAALWTYARKSVLRDMIRFVSKESEEPARPTVSGELLDEEVGKTPEDELATAECVSIASAEFSHLTEVERRVLRMRFVDDIDVRTVAARLNKSKSEIDRIYQNALGKLRETVGARV